MSRRVVIVTLLAALLALAGSVAYINSTSNTAAAAEDCAEKPVPKDEFALAAECEGEATPAAGQPAERQQPPSPAQDKR